MEVLNGGTGDFCGLLGGRGGRTLPGEELSVEVALVGLGLLAGGTGLDLNPLVLGLGLGTGDGDKGSSEAGGKFW